MLPLAPLGMITEHRAWSKFWTTPDVIPNKKINNKAKKMSIASANDIELGSGIYFFLFL